MPNRRDIYHIYAETCGRPFPNLAASLVTPPPLPLSLSTEKYVIHSTSGGEGQKKACPWVLARWDRQHYSDSQAPTVQPHIAQKQKYSAAKNYVKR